MRIPPWRLSRRIAGLAALNLVLFLIAVGLFVQREFGLQVESLILGPARDRIVGIANAFGRELDAAPYESRSQLLAGYSRRYGADFFLVDPRGRTLGGAQPDLPQPLLLRMQPRNQ